MSVSEVEKKLAKYRAEKQREAHINKYKSEAKNVFASFFGRKKKDPKMEQKAETVLREPLIKEKENFVSKPEFDRLSSLDSDEELEDDNNCTLTVYDYVYYVLCFTLWATIYAIFVKLQFGTIYFIFSLLIGIYLNTRTGPKKRNEISAYSVFNRNCESIDGTLKAEDLERQMLYGGFR